jgi:WD40 repeat protein
MNSLNNENILKLAFSSLTLLDTKRLFDRTNNKAIATASLKVLAYDKIFQSMGKSNLLITGHTSWISSLVTLSKCEIASSSNDITIKFWNPNTNQCIYNLEGHKASVKSLIKLNNSQFASCSLDGEIKIWKTKDNYKCIKTIYFEGYSSCHRLLLLPNNNLACSAYQSGTPCILIIDCNNNYSLGKILRLHTDWISSLVNIKDYKFASASKDRTIKVWDINQDYSCTKTIESAHFDWIYALLFDEDDLLFSSTYQFIEVWKISKNFECVRSIDAHNDIIRSLLLLPGGYFASGSNDKTIKIWSIKEHFKCINSFENHKTDCIVLRLLDDYRIVSASFELMAIWNY